MKIMPNFRAIFPLVVISFISLFVLPAGVSALDGFNCNGNEEYCAFYDEAIAGGAACTLDESTSSLPFTLPSCTWAQVNGTNYYCSSYRGTAFKASSQGEIINRVGNDTGFDMPSEISGCRALVNRFNLNPDTPLYENISNYTFAQDAGDTNNIINFSSIYSPVAGTETRCNGVNSLTGNAVASGQSFNLSLNGCILSESVQTVRVDFTATGQNETGFSSTFDGVIVVQSDGKLTLPSTNIPAGRDLSGYNNLILRLRDQSGNEIMNTSVALRTQQESEEDQQASEGQEDTPPTISSQFGPCNCGGGVQCSGEGKERRITKFPTTGTESYQCVMCLSAVGNTWVGGLGCINTTPQGIFLQLIRISMGVMGGVALLRLIFLGYQYQFGDQKEIQKAREGVLSTLAAIVIVLFSVLLLRIIGVNILDVVPTGFFGS